MRASKQAITIKHTHSLNDINLQTCCPITTAQQPADGCSSLLWFRSLAGNQISVLHNGTFNDLTDDYDDDNGVDEKKRNQSTTGSSTLLTLDLRANPLERIDPSALFGLTSLVTV